MTGYINKQALMDYTSNQVSKSISNNDIARFPIADVVEVVRCKDCEHLTVHNSPTLYAYCKKTHLRFEPFKTDTRTHFCSYGERKNDNG